MKEDYYYYILFLSYLETLFFFVCLEINYRVGAEDVIFFLFLYHYMLFFILYIKFTYSKNNVLNDCYICADVLFIL